MKLFRRLMLHLVPALEYILIKKIIYLNIIWAVYFFSVFLAVNTQAPEATIAYAPRCNF